MSVFVLGEKEFSRRVFHKTKDCYKIKKIPPRGERQKLYEVEIDDLRFQTPCLVCYPDAPRARSSRRYCKTCNSTRACAHNGGVPVPVERAWRKETVYHEVGETVTQTVYVWPEKVRHYISV